jgi:hypothetical protein
MKYGLWHHGSDHLEDQRATVLTSSIARLKPADNFVPRRSVQWPNGWGYSKLLYGLGYAPDHVLATVRVRDVNRAFRVVAPLTVDNESVRVSARSQINYGRPDAVWSFAHWDRVGLPVSEITDQQNAECVRGSKAKGFFMRI